MNIQREITLKFRRFIDERPEEDQECLIITPNEEKMDFATFTDKHNISRICPGPCFVSLTRVDHIAEVNVLYPATGFMWWRPAPRRFDLI